MEGSQAAATAIPAHLEGVLSRTHTGAQVWRPEGVGGEEGLLQRIPAAAEERGEGGGAPEVR
jgi:hypothetical protein